MQSAHFHEFLYNLMLTNFSHLYDAINYELCIIYRPQEG